ncbi:hypothetical protein ACWD0J_10430 [Streptomyces sp. NPDC003011]
MSTVVVHNEAGRRFDPLADRFKVIADEVVPLVESVTGLPLPDPVVIRLMRPRAWINAHSRRLRRQLAAEDRELSVPTADLRQVMVSLKAGRKTRRRIWPLVAGQAVEFTPGKPEICFMPQSLWEAGRISWDDFHYKVIAHEATHLAQYAATKGRIWAAQDTLFPHLRGSAHLDHSFLLEGHAYWSDREVTRKISGTSVSATGVSPHASARFQALQDTYKSSDKHALYEEKAADIIGGIITDHGLDVFNTIWTNPDLIPTTTETNNPATWHARFRSLKSA